MKLWVCIIHTNPLYCIQGRYWQTFMQCQIAQLKSKNRQKGGQFFYQIICLISVKIAILTFPSHTCIHHHHHRWWIFGWYTIFKDMKLKLLNMFKVFYWFELWGFIACSNRQFEWAWSFKHVPLPLKRDPCNSQADGTHKVTRKINIYCCLRNKKPKISEGWSKHAKFCVDQKLLGLEVGLQKIKCHFSFTDNLLEIPLFKNVDKFEIEICSILVWGAVPS